MDFLVVSYLTLCQNMFTGIRNQRWWISPNTDLRGILSCTTELEGPVSVLPAGLLRMSGWSFE